MSNERYYHGTMADTENIRQRMHGVSLEQGLAGCHLASYQAKVSFIRMF